MVTIHRGDEIVRLSLPSLVEHLKELLILLLEDLILHCYLVVLSLNLLNLSPKSKLLSFLPSLSHTRHEGVSFCVLWLPSLTMLERDT